MNDYYHKYIKYKSKYINLIYGGVGTPTKETPTINRPSWASVVKQSSNPQQTPSPQQPPQLQPHQPLPPVQPPPPSTPPQSTKPPPVTPGRGLTPGLTPGSTVALPSTPKLEIDLQTVESIIRSKNKLIKLLKSCVSLSNYDITQRTSGIGDFYINFKKKGELINFSHFSFHNPTDPPSTLKLNDRFDINPFHLRYDSLDNIFFNLRKDDDERLILQSPMKEEDIIALIGCENYYELIIIKNCLEEILNKPEIIKNIIEPIARALKF